MSMICRLLAISPERIGAIRATPSLATDLARAAQGERSNPRRAGRGPVQPALSLEKSWHTLHYVFTGQPFGGGAPGDALLTGAEFGDDLGYGPARLHDPEATADFARFLGTLTVAQLQARVKLPEMAQMGLYGLPMGPGPDAAYEDELRAEVAGYFPLLRDYVSGAAERREGLAVWLA